MKKAYRVLLLSVLVVVTNVLQAKTVKVLFIGNSYIYTNDIPLLIKQLAATNGDTLIYDQSTPGGYTLEQHCTNATTLAKIKAQAWDIVVLQEQSQKPAFPPSQVATDTYPYARTLDSLINDNNSCTETMFYMTWGRKNGDASNCQFYPPICTYLGMQASLRESYLQMAHDNSAITAPVGAAWKVVRDSLPNLDLYISDESHPNINGGYLSACVFYASIFHKSPYGNTFTSTLSATDAERIQHFAAKVTLDSIDKWTQYGDYVYADFTNSITAPNIRAFQNKSLKASSYKWDFGDTNTDMMANPSHTYAQAGIYTVTLSASNNCFKEQKSDTVHIGNVSVNSIDIVAGDVTVSQQGGGQVTLHIPAGYQSLQIHNISGAKVAQKPLNGESATLTYQLAPGTYIYTVDGIQRQGGKILVR
ncbi:MAG: PKD domain-containing protein [Chitinophagales bacterium]|nr:PKD domain-containing protein [Chitinophagales bacterium]